MEYSELLEQEPYGLDHTQKESLLTKRLVDLTGHHMSCCGFYKPAVLGRGGRVFELLVAPDFKGRPKP